MFKLVDKISKFLATLSCLRFLHNYFNGSKTLFSDIYPAQFLDTSTNSFFPSIMQFLSLFIKNNILKNIYRYQIKYNFGYEKKFVVIF